MNETNLVKIDLTDVQLAAILRKHKLLDSYVVVDNESRYIRGDASSGALLCKVVFDNSNNSREIFLDKRLLPKYRTRVYEVWTYDVWGNWRDGWQVNNRFRWGEKSVRCKLKIYNEGRPSAWADYTATDRQLNRMVHARGCVCIGGESDYTLYFETKSGKPAYELEFVEWRD